ncbi:MAG: DNA-binding response regulator [Marinilabiliales bacterium]|nr:MAG: DNA-binding response regulator [Marinilabiliales bacterium]
MENSENIRILLAEDDENLGFILKDFLEISGYDVVWVKDGNEAWTSFQSNLFDICILDVMMPLMDGFSLAKKIRSTNKNIPFIFLTAKAMKEDKIAGLELGADDYITKPFSTEELGLRIKNILKRYIFQHTNSCNTFKLGKIIFDYNRQILLFDDSEIRLTKKEAEVLKLLCENKSKILRREVALQEIWGDDDYFMGRSMDVYITKLRKHLKADPGINIKNIHGTGFMLEIIENGK